MRKSISSVLGLSLLFWALAVSRANGAWPRPGGPHFPSIEQTQSEQNQIKDPSESDNYTAALNQSDTNARVTDLETFLKLYPETVVREDAEQNLMNAYAQLGEADQAVDAAQKILAINPQNCRALALLAYYYETAVSNGNGDAHTNLQKAQNYAEQGIAAQQTAAATGASPSPDLQALNDELRSIFDGVLGFVALQKKDFLAA